MPLTSRGPVRLALLAALAALGCGNDGTSAGGASAAGGSAAAGSGGSGGAGRSSVAATGGADGGATALGRAGAAGAEGGSGPNRRDAGGPDAGDAAPCLDFSEPVAVGAVDLAELDQLSGLVASRTRPGVLFAHEDSTGAPIVYALGATGQSLATFTLEGAPNTDWEDIALGPGPDAAAYLFIGDIGDNAVRTGGMPRGEIAVIRLPEPTVALGQSFVQSALTEFDVLRFTYPSGVHEAETLMVDPRTGDLLIVTRSSSGDSHVFRAPSSTPPDTPSVLEEIGQLAFDPSGQGALATAGDISPAGDRVIVRTYTAVYVWEASPGAALEDVFRGTPAVVPWAVEPQGEAISFTADGRSWLVAGEQSATIYRSDEACAD